MLLLLLLLPPPPLLLLILALALASLITRAAYLAVTCAIQQPADRLVLMHAQANLSQKTNDKATAKSKHLQAEASTTKQVLERTD